MASADRHGHGPTGRVRICRQSIRDLQYWRKLTRGEGRDLIRTNPHLTLHSDGADVGYGGTLGFDTAAGSPGLWEGQGFWTTQDRAQSIALRKLRAVRLLLQRHFAAYVSEPHVRKVLLHEDNQSVVYVLNAMVSASKAMMQELRKLEVLLRVLRVRLEARWIPSAVNRFADSLSRTWDPGDVKATDSIVRSLQEEHKINYVVFKDRPLGETLFARQRYLASQMEENWGDGRARLWSPPCDFLPLVVRKIEADGGKGILVAPYWPAQAWFSRLKRLSTKHIASSRRRKKSTIRKRATHQREVVDDYRTDRVTSSWKAGIRRAVLSAADVGGAAANLLSKYCRAPSTWKKRASQLNRWLSFCDEELRCSLPATEGDVIATDDSATRHAHVEST